MSPILSVIFTGEEGVRFGNLRMTSLRFVDDVVLSASSDRDLRRALGWFAVEREATRMRVCTSRRLIPPSTAHLRHGSDLSSAQLQRFARLIMFTLSSLFVLLPWMSRLRG